ncbi:C-type lectin domain family 4 member K-like [Carettochelys insculpta]|uniref:C-type lectin domain family 4 member K-like n=1 Tax=Carettochelys insculpta TaxID=44489 RepID=UPI003EBED600
MARENIYENMQVSEAAPQPKGNPPKAAVPRWQRKENLTRAALLLLLLALTASLLAVTLLYCRGRSKLQAVEEAVLELKVSLQPDNASDASAMGSDSLELLGEVQAGVRMLREQLGNASAANRALQVCLDTVTAPPAAVQDCCRDVWGKLSAGWRFHGGNLYYFSQEGKSWDEAEQFCVSQGSHLTSISSQGEQEFLSNGSKREDCWIGLTDQGTEGRWRWVDGTEYSAEASGGSNSPCSCS